MKDYYVVECADGYSTYSYKFIEKRTKGVAEWLKLPVPTHPLGSKEALAAYKELMEKGESHHRFTGKRCLAELIVELIPYEGKRVEVTYPENEGKVRFIVGKSTGWLPCHLEIKTKRSNGGVSVYWPKGSTVKLVK